MEEIRDTERAVHGAVTLPELHEFLPLSERERRTAAAAAAWILAFNARWQAALIVHGVCDYATIALVRDHQEDYLSLSWH